MNAPGAASILIIDDEQQIRSLLYKLLSVDHDCVVADSAEGALNVLAKNTFDLVLSDINMPGISGLDLIPKILERSPDTVVVMISGAGNRIRDRGDARGRFRLHH